MRIIVVVGLIILGILTPVIAFIRAIVALFSGEISEDIKKGRCCFTCGKYFNNPSYPEYYSDYYSHSHIVDCWDCWKPDKAIYDKDIGKPVNKDTGTVRAIMDTIK